MKELSIEETKLVINAIAGLMARIHHESPDYNMALDLLLDYQHHLNDLEFEKERNNNLPFPS